MPVALLLFFTLKSGFTNSRNSGTSGEELFTGGICKDNKEEI